MVRMMPFKILAIISFSPSMEKTGPNLRILNLAKALCNNRIKSIIFHLGDENFIYNNFIHVNGINLLKQDKKSRLTFLHLLFIQIPYSIRLIKILSKLNVDIIVVSESHSLGFPTLMILFLARKFGYLKSPRLVILDKHNIYYKLVEELLRVKGRNIIISKIMSYIIKLLELLECKLSDSVFVTSRKDAELIYRYIGASRYTFILPNVVELPSSLSNGENVKKKLIITDDQLVLLFIGGLNYLPNLDAVSLFIKKVFPKLIKYGSIVFIVVGKSGKALTYEFPNRCKIIFTDYVEDITPYMLAADLCVVPLRIGSGTRIKILTCMAYGKVVITTSKGAEGLDLVNRKDIIISDVEGFHELILSIVREPTLREYIERNAKNTIKRKYSLDVLSKRLYVILRLLRRDLR